MSSPTTSASHEYDLSAYLDPAEVAEAFAPYNGLLDRLDLRDARPAAEL